MAFPQKNCKRGDASLRPRKNSARAGGLKLRPVDNSGRIQDLRHYPGNFASRIRLSANEVATSVTLAIWQSSPQATTLTQYRGCRFSL